MWVSRRFRSRLVLGLLCLAALWPAAATASASESLGAADDSPGGGEGCPANETYVQTESSSTNYAAGFDGVITSWTVNGDWSKVKLLIARPGSSGSYTVAAADGPRTLQSGTNTFPVRILVRQGDTLGLFIGPAHYCMFGSAGEGAFRISDSDPAVGDPIGFSPGDYDGRVPVAAQLERDDDGDGYGDETQDGCPTDGSTHGPCPLPVVLGQTFSPHYPTCAYGTSMPLSTPATVSAVQTDGVLSSWSYQSLPGATGTVQLKVLQPLGGDLYLAKAEDTAHAIAPESVNTFPVRIPVRTGDRIAIRSTGAPVCGFTTPDWSIGFRGDDLAIGTSGTLKTETGLKVDLSAVEEPDADGDGFGDRTQDSCPTDASTAGPCPSATGPLVVAPLPASPACLKARSKLKAIKAKLGKLKKDDAPAARLKAAKKKLRKAKAAVKKSC